MVKRAGWVAVAAAVVVAASCTNDFGKFGFESPPEGGFGGTMVNPGGMGGAMGGAGGTTMSSSSTGTPGQCANSGIPSCFTATDCPGMNSTCLTRNCINSCCANQFAGPTTPCTEGGGQWCDGMGQCVECNNDTHCTNEVCDTTTHTCVPPTCMVDNMINGSETDIDCGGPVCPGCADGSMCMQGSDCLGGVCDGSNLCQPCTGDPDCSTLPGTFCNAGVCDPQLVDGTACTAPNECLSGSCTDGVCCDTACAGTCEACDVSGSIGTCAPVPNATDPDNECAATPQSSCGANGMGCNGAGACVLWSNSTQCSMASCTAGVATSAANCDGMGTCGSTTTMCTPYVCGLVACLTDCSANGDADCISTHYCNGANQCVPKLAQGQMCTTANQCTTGNCADNFCCNVACGGLCQSCAAADTGGTNGTCAPVTMGTDPAMECGTNCCNGANMCDSSNACP